MRESSRIVVALTVAVRRRHSGERRRECRCMEVMGVVKNKINWGDFGGFLRERSWFDDLWPKFDETVRL
jgi:hypothetical protein